MYQLGIVQSSSSPEEGILCASPDGVVGENEDVVLEIKCPKVSPNKVANHDNFLIRDKDTEELILNKKHRFYMEDLGPELVHPMFPTTGQFRQPAYRRDAIKKDKEHAAEKQARKAAAEQAKKVDQILTAQDPGISDEDFEDILRLP
ncbi:hypothetical protein FQR65_LT19280 [Abscondita terminalis]|nr:hypothetical protein FQR65_LT19280 [Abscondita terminalis]